MNRDKELKLLEVAIYDLKTENNRLRKDKARLDWLIDNASIYIFRKDEDGDEWWGDLEYSEPRKDIDKAMEEANI